jgi:hypothetical protein
LDFLPPKYIHILAPSAGQALSGVIVVTDQGSVLPGAEVCEIELSLFGSISAAPIAAAVETAGLTVVNRRLQSPSALESQYDGASISSSDVSISY